MFDAGSPTPGACRTSGTACMFTAGILAVYRFGAWLPAPGVNSDQIKSVLRLAGDGRARPAEPLLGRRAVAVRGVRARDHAVRHRLDHPAAHDRGDPEAGGAPEGGRGRLRQDQPVHALPHRRARGAAGDGLRVPVQAPGRHQPELRQPRAHRHHADGRHRAADVVRRADHEARHRQRHLDPDLRVDPLELPARRERLVQRRRHRAAVPADHGGRRSSSRSSSSRRASGASRSSTRSGWWAAASRRAGRRTCRCA